MSLRLPKIPLIFAALLTLTGGGVLLARYFFAPEFAFAGIPGDLLGIGILGFAFLVFALSFALATPVEKTAKPARIKKEKRDKSAVTMLGEESAESFDSPDEKINEKRERRLAARAEKAAKLAAAKKAKEEASAEKASKKASALADKESAKDNAGSAKENASAARKAAKEEAIAAKLAIKEAKAAERKRREEEDDDDDEFLRTSGEDYLKPLTKEEQEALKENAELSKAKAKEEAEFVRNAQKQAKVAAKLAAQEEKLRLAQEKKRAQDQATLDKINAKIAATAEKLRLKEEKRVAKLNANQIPTEPEYFQPEQANEPEEILTAIEELDNEIVLDSEETSSVVERSEFDAPELSVPSDEEIYGDKEFIIPFSSEISSREAKLLQSEFIKRIEELNDKVLTLESSLTEKSDN